MLNLKLVVLNESWASGIISLVQSCNSLRELRVSVTGLLLEKGLMLLKKSLTDPHCTVIIEGRKCSKPTEENQSHICNEEVEIHFKPKVLEKLEESAISKPSSSGLNLHLLPVCQFCVHIVDPDQWVQVEPSVCTDEGGSEFRISTPAGRFECSRTRMRWVCAGDVTLQYRAVDGRFLRAELERLQCERIGPVIDVTVISGKLEEAHLPHYTCLAESDPSLTDAVKLLTKRDEGISLQSVKLTQWSDIIVQYKASVIDKCKVATEYNLPCVDLTACYTEPVIIQRSKRQNEKYYCEHVRSVDASSHLLSNDKNHSIRIEQFFSPDCDGNKPKSVILRGDSGMGKSFMLQKIMLDWASGELYSEIFDVMFLFKCEELKCVSGEMNLFELLSWSCSLTSDQISQILELTQEKVLILIDGIDEYVSHPPSHSMLLLTNPSDRARPMDILRSVLKGILLSESFMLVTTRSIADDAVMNLLKGPQRFTEIVGFSERGVQEYFQKFFQDEKLFRKTYKSLKSNESLLTACSVPLPCWMVCFCLEKHFTDGDHVMRELKTNTSIYVHFVSTLLEHHDQSQSVLTMLRSLGQRAEEGMTKREGLFVKKSLTVTGLNPATNVFLHKDSLKRNNRQDEEFVRRALGDRVSMDLSNVSLRSTDCWVLLYCLQCCPHIRDLDLMYCDLTTEKLKILQPALCMCETMRLSVEQLSEVGDLIQNLGESKILRELKLSSSSSEKNQSFPAILNISLTCPQPEISSTDWTLFLQRLSKAVNVAEDSSALNEYVSLLMSSFHSMGMKTLDLKLVSLNESWASGIISLVQTCTSLQQLSVCADLLLEEGIMLLKKSLTDPHCTVIIEGRKCSKPTDQCKEHDCNHSCCDKVKIHFRPKVLEEQKKLKISEPESSGLNLHPLPVCQSCVHIVDSDQWVQVEALVCTDEEGSEFRISTPAGRFECIRTRMRWVCAGDVTLQYRAVDGRFLSGELERRIGPVIDVKMISGKLEEAHLPHYACLEKSYPSLTDAVKVVSIKDEEVFLKSVELTRFHAKILQPSFGPTTVIKEKGIPVEQHLDLLIFMTNEDPLILHVYFLPLFDTFSKEKIEQEETANNALEIEHPSPSMKIQMDTLHVLQVSGATVLPEEQITFLISIHPIFFKIKQDIDGDVQMTLIKEQHEMFVWKTIIWKDKLNQKKDLMAKLSTEMSKHNLEGQKRKPQKGWSDIILHYKASVIDKCKFVTECNLPSDERVELAGLYTEPVMIQKSKEQIEKYYRQHVRSARASGSKPSSQLLSNDKNHSIKIDQLFSPDSDGNTPKTVILSGDSGRGKSFMLQKIMVDWAFGKLYYRNFDIIFLLNCEELKCISEEMSLSELLSWSCSLRSDQISQILELKPEKVLILIDGIDEYIFHHPSHSMLLLTNLSDRARPMDILRSVSKGILLHESFILVTTRSIAADAVMNLLKGPQRFTEIMGFSEKGVQEYFQKFFQDEKLFRKTYESMKINETILTACSVPLLCWMVCFCLKKHFGSDHVMRELKTTTSIYVHFVSTLLEHHDQSQSVLTMLRSLGQRAEEGVKRREGLFVENSLTVTGLNPATNVFLHKDSLKRNNRQVPVFKFMHFSFQEFFTGLYYVLLDKEQSWRKVKALLTSTWSSPERRSNPSVMMFLCGLLNEKVSSSLFEMIKWTVPHTRKLKTSLSETVLTMRRQNGYELFALHCLYELQNEEFVKKALGDWVTMDLSNISLRSTDCWVLLYCLQCCPHIRDLDLTYCDLTSEKLKILQPALSMCETMRLSVEHLSEVGDLIQILGKSKFLKKMRLSLNSSVKNPSFPAILNISLTCPKSEISNTDWTLFLQRLSKARKIAEDSSALDEHVRLLLSSFLSVGLKTLNLKLVSLNESWASGIIFLAQTCTSLQELGVSVSGLLLEDGLMLLEKSLTDPHCTVIIEGRKCSKPTDQCKEQDWSYSCNEKVKIHFKPKVLEKLEEPTRSEPKPSGLNLYPLPVCQSCVHIVDSDQWVHVEPSVCTDDGGSEFRISTPAGRFECSRTRMRWVCAGDVTLQYRAVDGRFLRAELERLQCERIGPVTDVTVISGKLEEAHLPHYACLAESDPSLKNNVRLLSKSDEGISLQSVELTRYHAKIVQPSFSIITLILSWFIKWEEHCDLLLFMQCKDPLFLHIYFFPVNDTCSKEKVEQNEKSSLLIRHPRPDRPFQLKTPHLLEVPGASVQPEEGISFRTDIDPNFFMVRKQQHGHVQINLIREVDKKSVWKATIWKEKFGHLNARLGESSHEEEEQKPSKETQFVDRNYAALIQRVSSVKAIADELKNNGMIHHETLSEIKAEQTNQDKMRKLFEALNSGGDTVKNTFYYALKNQEPSLFRDLGGDN
ncbi:hypothetical protein Q8A67_008673 [Cirrhinus molitorella]|uniref:NACHT domain-containing protein n=1 Tax=Cirrhinus molitorella TaxID=172907 RepID=A0AA88TNV8_9TELE|nr:hypothetical protein Q8A67_008673 [Cirrhinus molitorella]